MISKYNHTKWLKFVFVFLYAALAFFLPLNKVGLSISTMLLAFVTVLVTPFSSYVNAWKSNKSFQWLLLLFVFSFISLLWSNSFSEGLKFINLILPFYLIFFVLTLYPVSSEKDLSILFHTFLIAVLFTTLVNLLTHMKTIESLNYDKRNLSLFTSHIRLSLMVVISIVLCGYLFLKNTSKWKWIYIIAVVYFLYYTYFAEVISGYISLILLVLSGLTYRIYSGVKWNVRKIGISVSMLVLIIAGLFFILKKELKPSEQKALNYTKKGNPYLNDTLGTAFDNGYSFGINIQLTELEEEWNKRSLIKFDSLTNNGASLKWNLIRYMTSKGLNKDAEGIWELSQQDVTNIENGYVSILQFKNPLVARVLMMKDELLSINANPNGYTFLQRLAYWKAGKAIFSENFLIGVGSGGAKKAFQDYYEKTNSNLEIAYQKQSHQQFLSVAINYGLVGLVFFLFFIFYLFKECNPSFFRYVILLILISSFFMEDTLETQVGATLFAFFAGLFIRVRANSKQQERGLSN